MTRRRWAPIAAAVICSAVFVGVLVFGHVTYPAFASLTAVPPDVEGRIAVLVSRGSEYDDEDCLLVIEPATGASRELRCTYRWSELTGWSEDGYVIVTLSDESTQRSLFLDPDTGTVVRRGFEYAPLEPAARGPGPRLFTEGPDGVARIVEEDIDGEQRVVYSVDGPRSYEFTQAVWSPDGRWVLALDSQERLVIVDPRTDVAWQVTEDVSVASWHVEGRPSASRVGW